MKNFYGIIFLICSYFSFSQELKRVKNFGRNKDHLKMYVHTLPVIETDASFCKKQYQTLFVNISK